MLKKITLASLILMTLPLSAFAIDPVMAVSTPAAFTLPPPPATDARAYILLDANSGKVLAEKNADSRLPPASLTKLLSLYIISNALKSGTIHADDKVRVSKKAWQTGGSKMFVKVDEDVSVRDLLAGIVVASGNDASVAMAEFLGGTEDAFANLMNEQAKKLGMTNSHFMDSTGLPNPNHYSTPRDLARLAQALTQTFPEDYRLFAEKWFSYHGIKQPNRNRLLWRYQYADGLKTGHTDEAGFCLVASAIKDGMRLISVVMGASSDLARTEDSIRLLTYGFRFYETHKLYDAATPLMLARVWQGAELKTALGITTPLYITVPTGQYPNIRAHMQLSSAPQAPIYKNQSYGTLTVSLNNQVIAAAPLVALTPNSRGGIIRRISDALQYRWQKLFSAPQENA